MQARSATAEAAMVTTAGPAAGRAQYLAQPACTRTNTRAPPRAQRHFEHEVKLLRMCVHPRMCVGCTCACICLRKCG